MGSDTPSPYSEKESSQMSTNYEEMSMQHSLQFADSLMDLKNLRIQLYSAAEHFESSYDKNEHRQFVVDSSKDYVSKALVSTVDHLGCVADKLTKFLDEKANEFSVTNVRFSSIEQRLNTYHVLIDSRGVSQQSLMNDVHDPKYHKRYISPAIDKSNVSWRNCKSSPENDTYQADQESFSVGNSFSTVFQTARVKPQPPIFRKGHSRTPSYESSPKPLSFSFSRVISNKEAGKRAVSPLRFPLKRSGSVVTTSTSVSPIRSVNQRRWPSEPRRATLGSTKPDMSSNREIESCTKKEQTSLQSFGQQHSSVEKGQHAQWVVQGLRTLDFCFFRH